MSGAHEPDPTLGLMGPSQDLIALSRRLQGSFLGRCIRRFLRMAGIDRCLVLSSQAFTALIPLLIVITALVPAHDANATADLIVRKFGLTGDAAASVEELFATPTDATATLSIASALLMLFSGVSFTRRLQRMYRSAWDQEAAGIRGGLFAALGLLTLLTEVLVLMTLNSLLRDLPLHFVWALPLAVVTGLFLWTSIPYLLLRRQVHWRRLLGAGAVTAVGTAVLGLATTIYMGPLVTQYTQQFGLFGITIAIFGWLLSAAAILVSGAAIGAEFDATSGRRLNQVKKRLGLHDPSVEPPADGGPDAVPGLTSADVRLLIRVLVNWGVLAAAVWAATALVPGIEVMGGFVTYFAVSLLLGLVNAVVAPLLSLVALPLSWFTVGGAALVVNTVLVAVTAGLTTQLDIEGLGSAVGGALVISVATTVLELVVRPIQKIARLEEPSTSDVEQG